MAETPSSFDLVVIGGGPAGTSGASAAGLLGKKVALIEQASQLGGAGINTGTIPSKTLRETSLILSGWRSRRLFGVDLSLRREATIGEFMYHEERVTRTERRHVETTLGRLGVVRHHGKASFVDAHTLCVTHPEGGAETLVRGEKILIATGSSPVHPPGFPFADERVHDSNEILSLKTIPKRLAVVGAGVIGAEYAGTFAALGTQVHLIDGRNSLLPFLDLDVSRALESAMKTNGVRFLWGEKVVQCDTSAPDLRLTFASGQSLICDGVLVCAGRSSNTQDLNIGAAGLVPGERGLIPVGPCYQSVHTPNIYAAGDVIGFPALAATGIEQARVAVSHAFGETMKCDIAPLLPTGIYTIPEASMVGDTEATLVQKGVPYLIGRARYRDIPRGDIIGDQTGFLKLLFHRETLRLLGVHVLGEHATEVVHIGLVAMLAEATAELFNRACFNYPTLGDLYKYAAYDALWQRRQRQKAGASVEVGASATARPE